MFLLFIFNFSPQPKTVSYTVFSYY